MALVLGYVVFFILTPVPLRHTSIIFGTQLLLWLFPRVKYFLHRLLVLLLEISTGHYACSLVLSFQAFKAPSINRTRKYMCIYVHYHVHMYVIYIYIYRLCISMNISNYISIHRIHCSLPLSLCVTISVTVKSMVLIVYILTYLFNPNI